LPVWLRLPVERRAWIERDRTRKKIEEREEKSSAALAGQVDAALRFETYLAEISRLRPNVTAGYVF
jgi:hypothetical protein